MISKAQDVCNNQKVPGSAYVQFANYLGPNDRCLYNQWQRYLNDAIKKGNNLGQMTRFYGTVGNNYYTDLVKTYPSLTWLTAQYNSYLNTISSAAAPMPALYNNIGTIMGNANNNYVQNNEQIILMINALLGALSSAKLSNSLKYAGCDLPIIQKLFAVSDLFVSCWGGCANQFVNTAQIESNLSDAIYTWFTLYYKFKVCAAKPILSDANKCISNVSVGNLPLILFLIF